MTAPHTGPSEEQVRKALQRGLDCLDGGVITLAEMRAALALLDAGRKDREYARPRTAVVIPAPRRFTIFCVSSRDGDRYVAFPGGGDGRVIPVSSDERVGPPVGVVDAETFEAINNELERQRIVNVQLIAEADEARGVRAVEHLMRGDNLSVKWDALSGAFFLSSEAEIGEDTLAALGLALLKQGKVTL